MSTRSFHSLGPVCDSFSLELATNGTESTIRILHRTLNEKLKTFNGKIYYIIDDVDKGANIDMFKNLEHQIMSVGGAVKKMSGMVISIQFVNRVHC